MNGGRFTFNVLVQLPFDKLRANGLNRRFPFLIRRTAELSASTKSWPTRAELAPHRDAWLHDCQVISVRQRTDANDKFQ